MRLSGTPRLSPRAAVTGVFFVNGAMFSTWASRIPALSDRVHASPGTLSLALLAPAVGAVIVMPVVGRLLVRHASRSFCLAAVIALAVTLPLPALAHSVPALALALLAVGMGNAALDLSMNAQGVSVERGLGRPILSSLHAFFSIGGMVGAGVGALAADLDVAPLAHFGVAAVLIGIIGVLMCTGLVDDRGQASEAAQRLSWRRLPPRLVLIGVACFVCFLAEGASSDWSAKLVNASLGGSAAVGALAYSAFSAAMATGRLIFDRLWLAWGNVALLRRSGALAAVGFAAGLAVGTPLSAILGFITLGLGLSGVVPTLFRSGSQEPNINAGPALATVSIFGYTGLLAGPPLVGGLAQLTSLRLACGLLVLGGLTVAALAGAAAVPTRTASDPDPEPEPMGAPA